MEQTRRAQKVQDALDGSWQPCASKVLPQLTCALTQEPDPSTVRTLVEGDGNKMLQYMHNAMREFNIDMINVSLRL